MARSKLEASQCEPLTVRFPEGMLDQVRQYAEVDDRSLNSEIVHALRQWLRNQALNDDTPARPPRHPAAVGD